MDGKLRKRAYEILERAEAGDLPSKVFDVFVMTLISLNVVAVIMETVEGLSSRYMVPFRTFEVFSIIVFTVEYILRLWSCTVSDRFRSPVGGRIRFALTPFAVIDLIAILPFYLPMVLPIDLRFVRAVRLFRLFRLLKMGRYSDAAQVFGNVLAAKKEQLVLTAFVVLIILVLVSSLMYYFEHEAQPDAFSSIPAAMWWGVATLTTVGYGDVYPITPMGKFSGALIAVLGVGMFALPAGILASGFSEEIRKRREGKHICPHCGKNVD